MATEDYGFKTPHWPGPYHPSWPPEEGDWVMWVMPTFVKVGQVQLAVKTSMVVWFQAHTIPTVIPDAYQYWDAHADYHRRRDGGIAPYTMLPWKAPKIDLGAPAGPTCSVAQAAAILGSTSKDVRRLLRLGQIKGRQDKGRWVEVERDSLNRHKAAEPPPMD